MKTKIICLSVITLLIASAFLPVGGTINVNFTLKREFLEYTNDQKEILSLILKNNRQLKNVLPINVLNDGAIWTTLDDCGDIQQNVNHYYTGDIVYVNGANFDPNTQYNWNIIGAPCSCDPNIVVVNGIVNTDGYGDFCFNAYTIQSDDCGVYHVNVGNKNDNFKVLTYENDPPLIYNPNPINGATNISVTISELNVTIEDPEGDTIDWTITTSPNIGSNSGTGENNGSKTCAISGLEYDTTYTWYVTASDPNGSGNTSNVFFTFTTETEANSPPVISNPNPTNDATGIPITTTELSVTIEDPEGDAIDWTIETNPNIGSNTGTNENNGTKTCIISDLEYGTIYTWYVNATDTYSRGGTTEEVYTFTTMSSSPPVISNPNPTNSATGIPITLSELSVTIEDPEGDTIDWTITTSPNIGSNSGTGENNGTKTCSISGLEYDTTYTWYVNATDPDGSGETTEETYTFTTMSNDPPVISNPDPSNGATDVSVSISVLSVTIEDLEGDLFDWSITTSPDIGSSSGNGEGNGTKTCSVSDLDYDTTYTWYISATDTDGSGETTEKTYTFTTIDNLPPVIFNPDPEDGISGVSIYVSVLSVTIEDPEGDLFDWSITTSPDIGNSSGTNESNGTMICDVYCGLDYNTTYTWYVTATDPDGSGETSEEVYTFTTELEGNNPPVISNPNPKNDATNIPITLNELCVTIEDPEGDTFNWSIKTIPDIGSSSDNGEGNGTKTCSVSDLDYETTYRWVIEAIDPDGSSRTIQRVCRFTTELEPIKTPNTPEGPTCLDIGESGEYCTRTTADKGKVQYRFDWDAEGSHDFSYWSDFVSSGAEVCMEHAWGEWGRYIVKAQARDEVGTTSGWSDGLTVYIGNHPPNAPTITGPPSGQTGKVYTYKFNSIDPNSDNVKYHIEWGDGKTETTALIPSGTDIEVKHTWSINGVYTIKAKAEDSNGLVGPETSLAITMPRNRLFYTQFITLLQHFQNLFLVLKLLFQRFRFL